MQERIACQCLLKDSIAVLMHGSDLPDMDGGVASSDPPVTIEHASPGADAGYGREEECEWHNHGCDDGQENQIYGALDHPGQRVEKISAHLHRERSAQVLRRSAEAVMGEGIIHQ